MLARKFSSEGEWRWPRPCRDKKRDFFARQLPDHVRIRRHAPGRVDRHFFVRGKAGHRIEPATADDSDGWFLHSLNQFQQDAAGGGWMDEDIEMSARAGARLVQQSRAVRFQALHRGGKIRRP